LLIIVVILSLWSHGIFIGYQVRVHGEHEDLTYNRYYKALGVENGVSLAEVRQAYTRLVMQLHPDKNPGASLSRLNDVQLAWNVLKHHLNPRREEPPHAPQPVDTDNNLNVQNKSSNTDASIILDDNMFEPKKTAATEQKNKQECSDCLEDTKSNITFDAVLPLTTSLHANASLDSQRCGLTVTQSEICINAMDDVQFPKESVMGEKVLLRIFNTTATTCYISPSVNHATASFIPPVVISSQLGSEQPPISSTEEASTELSTKYTGGGWLQWFLYQIRRLWWR